MISISRLKEMTLEDIENNPEKHLEEYAELLQQLDQLKGEKEELQYQLRCVTGREKEYRKNSDFWEKRYEKLKEQFFQLRADNEKYQLFIEKLCDYAGLECDSEEQAIRTLSDFASQMYKAKVINDQLKVSKEQAEQKFERIRDIADTIYKYANRLDENNWGILGCRIIEQTKQITQIIDEVENAR